MELLNGHAWRGGVCHEWIVHDAMTNASPPTVDLSCLSHNTQFFDHASFWGSMWSPRRLVVHVSQLAVTTSRQLSFLQNDRIQEVVNSSEVKLQDVRSRKLSCHD